MYALGGLLLRRITDENNQSRENKLLEEWAVNEHLSTMKSPVLRLLINFIICEAYRFILNYSKRGNYMLKKNKIIKRACFLGDSITDGVGVKLF